MALATRSTNRWTLTRRLGATFAAGAMLVAGSAMAQGDAAPMVANGMATNMNDLGQSWSDPEFQSIADKLIGSWRTTTAAPSADDDSAHVVMHVGAAPVEGLSDTMYVEVAREDGLSSPYYQAVFQLYRSSQGVRLRTYEFRAEGGLNPAFAGVWALGDLAPTIDRGDIVARLDINLRPEGSGHVGQTPYPYPTARGGAMEMTSRIEIIDGRIRTRDQGLDAMGNVVWGSGDDTAYEFEPFDAGVSVSRWSDGLASISYGGGGDGLQVADGRRVVFDYTGYLADGSSFDSSFKPGGRPLDYMMPGRLIAGWTRAVQGMTKGERRRIVIPPALGYGPGGNPRAGISGSDVLYFDVDLIAIEEPAPVTPTPTTPAATPSGLPTRQDSGAAGRPAPQPVSPQRQNPQR
ncbi:MAG: CpcT/CpeT family chromophore lyase [Planctomycetota bacterium]